MIVNKGGVRGWGVGDGGSGSGGVGDVVLHSINMVYFCMYPLFHNISMILLISQPVSMDSFKKKCS